MPEQSEFRRLIKVCGQFETKWRQGRLPRIEAFLEEAADGEREGWFRSLLAVELDLRAEDGDSPALDDYLQRFPDRESIIRKLFGGGSRISPPPAGLSRLPDFSPSPFADGHEHEPRDETHNGAPGLAFSPSAWGQGPLDPRSRYSIENQQPLDGGGCGEVFRAIDQELAREVALKKLQPQNARRPDLRSRFWREARVTALLDHPNIVPIYGYGLDADGRPFYAMKLIHGQNLGNAIQAFHKAGHLPARGSGPGMLAFRQLLTRFLSVCDAIAFAHDRGVIHRDLKPGNIMLGEFGETFVVDWGFAKFLRPAPNAQTNADANADDDANPDLLPPNAWEVEEEETLSGAVMGTVRYMPPEQASGDQNRIDERSDIFSLGATFYAILANKPPISGADRDELRRNARESHFRDPREVNPAIDPALESICLKAMRRLPEDRYPSVRLLAQDLERWLADESVSTYADPPLVTAARWTRRHRTWAAATIALLITAALGMAIGNVFIVQEKERVQQAKNHSDANLELAREAIRRALTQIVSGPLAVMPQAEPLRRALAKDALSLLQRLLERNPDDPRLLLEKAELLRELGNIERQFGNASGAIGFYQEALDICNDLSSQFPLIPIYKMLESTCFWEIGETWRHQGYPSQAEAKIQDGLEILELASASFPRLPQLRRLKGRMLYDLADARFELGQFEKALRACDDAQGLLSLNPAAPSAEDTVTLILIRLKRAQALRNATPPRSAEALRTIQEAVEQATGLLSKAQKHDNNLIAVKFMADFELGRTLASLPLQSKEAIRLLRQAVSECEQLSDQFLSTSPYRQHLGWARTELAETLAAAGQLEEARLESASACQLLEKLASDFPQNANYAGCCGRALVLAGRLNLAGPSSDKARTASLFQKAQKHLEEAWIANPFSPSNREARRTCMRYLSAK